MFILLISALEFFQALIGEHRAEMKSKMTRLGCVLKKMEMIDSDGEIKGKKTQDHKNLCMIISVFF